MGKKITGEGVRDNVISSDKWKSLIKKLVKEEEGKNILELLFSGFKFFRFLQPLLSNAETTLGIIKALIKSLSGCVMS